jgi:hypothetical protein
MPDFLSAHSDRSELTRERYLSELAKEIGKTKAELRAMKCIDPVVVDQNRMAVQQAARLHRLSHLKRWRKSSAPARMFYCDVS